MSTYTEEEAKKKWCPAARVVDFGKGQVAFNRSDESKFLPLDPKCFGSACMWWRWSYGEITYSEVFGKIQLRTADEKPVKGYCGMAGRPE